METSTFLLSALQRRPDPSAREVIRQEVNEELARSAHLDRETWLRVSSTAPARRADQGARGEDGALPRAARRGGRRRGAEDRHRADRWAAPPRCCGWRARRSRRGRRRRRPPPATAPRREPAPQRPHSRRRLRRARRRLRSRSRGAARRPRPRPRRSRRRIAEARRRFAVLLAPGGSRPRSADLRHQRADRAPADGGQRPHDRLGLRERGAELRAARGPGTRRRRLTASGSRSRWRSTRDRQAGRARVPGGGAARPQQRRTSTTSSGSTTRR